MVFAFGILQKKILAKLKMIRRKEMKSRSIRKIIPAQKVNMGGIYLDQPLPAGGIDQIDPFILLHHWYKRIESGENQKDQGVGPHPHKGEEEVYYITKGIATVDDNGEGTYDLHPGDAMHTGKGTYHSIANNTDEEVQFVALVVVY